MINLYENDLSKTYLIIIISKNYLISKYYSQILLKKLNKIKLLLIKSLKIYIFINIIFKSFVLLYINLIKYNYLYKKLYYIIL